MTPELLDRLRSDLESAAFTTDRVRALLGEDADAARLRGVFAPAHHMLDQRPPGAAAALIRLFLLGVVGDDDLIAQALPTLGAEGATALGLLARDPSGGLRAGLSLNPVSLPDGPADTPEHWWILSDLDDQLRRAPARPDHVMGVGGATRSLIAMLPPGPVSRSLDLGTGCGIVALHLARRGPVIATDVSQRALDLARANARLNRIDGIEFRRGDLFAPVAGERFDLVASNPPFVVTPRGDDEAERFSYRDGGLVGDALVQRVVSEAPAYLTDGGELICLANWESHWGSDGLARVAEWISTHEHPLAAWVIERDRVSPTRYAETWARDGGARPGDPEFERLLGTWLADFRAREIVALGLGSIRLRRLVAGSSAVIRTEAAEGPYSTAPGAALSAAFDAAIEASAQGDDAILDRRWLRDDDVSEERVHTPGNDAPSAITLVASRGIARRVTADTLLAAAVGASDGDLTLRQIADALADLLEAPAPEVAAALVAGVRELVWLGVLRPAPADRLDD